MVEPFYLWIKEKNPGIKQVAAIGPNDESGRDSNSVIVNVAKKLGYEVVADEYYARETKDFYPLLTRVLATNPDYIDVSNSPGGSAGLLVKQMHELGWLTQRKDLVPLGDFGRSGQIRSQRSCR